MFTHLSHFLHQLRQLDRLSLTYLTLLIIGLGWVFFGLVLLTFSSRNQVELSNSQEQSGSESELGQVMIDVSGAVQKPGVYKLSYGSRVAEAISAAGGLKPEADNQTLIQNLNLAEKVSDGQKIFIPFFRAELKTEAVMRTASESEVITTNSNSALISLNQASAKELETLPGIGAKKANDLIAGRPYTNLESAQTVAKLSDAQWLEIKSQLKL